MIKLIQAWLNRAFFQEFHKFFYPKLLIIPLITKVSINEKNVKLSKLNKKKNIKNNQISTKKKFFFSLWTNALGLDGNRMVQVWNMARHFLPVLLQACGEFHTQNVFRRALSKTYYVMLSFECDPC